MSWKLKAFKDSKIFGHYSKTLTYSIVVAINIGVTVN